LINNKSTIQVLNTIYLYRVFIIDKYIKFGQLFVNNKHITYISHYKYKKKKGQRLIIDT